MVASILKATADSFLSKALGNRDTPIKRKGEDFPDGFVVSEYIGTATKANTRVALVGDMMPKVPFTTSAKQHIAKEYYPGNPEAAVQILGAREEPLTIKGEFMTIRYADETLAAGNLRDVAVEMTKHFEGLRKRGNLLQLVLGDWERWGYLSQTTFNMKTRQRIEYEFQFEIVSETRPVNAKLLDDSAITPAAANAALISAKEVLEAQKLAAPSTMPQTLFDVINSAISTVASKLNMLTGFIDASISSAEDARRLADRGLGLVKNSQAAVADFQRRVGALKAYSVDPKQYAVRIPKSQGHLKNQKYINETALIAAKKQQTDGQLSPRSLADILAELRATFAELATKVPKARHLVADGDTLQGISVKFYGNADNASKIADHNKLKSTALVSGTVLEIPNL